MKKILSVILLAALGASLCACSHNNNSGVQSTTVFVSYDYGRLSKGRITTLYNSCLLDFQFDAPEQILIPGDRVTFKHTGYMLSTMSYPGKTQLSGGDLIGVEYSYAKVGRIEPNKIIRNEQGIITSVDSADGVKHVIINEYFDFVTLSEYSGDVLYASYSDTNSDGKDDVAALFAFNPRP